MKTKRFDLRQEILGEHSKTQCEKIRSWVGNDQERFDALFDLFIGDEPRICQRAAWPLSYCACDHPLLIKKRMDQLISNLSRAGIHAAVKRNTLRILQAVPLPEKYQGEIMTACFRYIESPDEPVAIKAFALTILGNLSKLYPEIIPELMILVEEQSAIETAAFKSRAKKLRTQLKIS